MAGLRIDPGTPASLVRCSTTELSRPIFMVHLVRTTTFLPPYKVFALEDTHDKHKFTVSGLIKYKCLNREDHGTKCSRDGRNEQIQRNIHESIWLDRELNLGPLHH